MLTIKGELIIYQMKFTLKIRWPLPSRVGLQDNLILDLRMELHREQLLEISLKTIRDKGRSLKGEEQS